MKKIISVILAAMLMMCCLAGCGANGKTLEDVKSAGKLVIATSPDFPPFEGLSDGGAVEGIEIDILNIIVRIWALSLISRPWTSIPF